MLQKHDNNLIWIDLEMTGLDPEQERIIEIATIVTSPDLSIVAEGPNLVIKQEDRLLDAMGEWVTTQHGQSGLTAAVRQSDTTEAMAEAETITFLKQYAEAGLSPMCGNTVSHDRRFLKRYMPSLEAYFHYRHVDVSTIKELAKRWKPELIEQQPRKDTSHRALDDIRESIEELKFFRAHFFKA